MSFNDKMQNLVDILNHHAKLYYKFDNPVITDAEYDKLYDELVLLETESGVILPDSPTCRIGGETLKEFKQYTHSHKLYSLDKCQSLDEFNAWLNRISKILGSSPELSVEYKFDGLTLNMVYENGILVSAATRGNGEVGEEVTEQVKTIKNIPLSIDYKGHIEIQGEGIMRLSVLKQYNNENTEQLKNARNAAAGAIRNLNPKVTATRKLDIMCYNAYGDIEFKTQAEMQSFLIKNGFDTGDFFEVVNSVQMADKLINEINERRNKLDYLIDGIVFKVNNVAMREVLGVTEKFPRWAVAYKFKADEATTIVKDVIWQVSRTSKLNPLAILEPVELSGATIQRATLNNYADIIKKDIKIGSRVFIRRSNDVIPEIIGVAEHNENSVDIEKPKVCPYCDAPVIEDGVFLYCANKDTCASQIVAKLTHFASKPAMNIEGFSEKTAELLLNELNVKDFSDLYELTVENLRGLEGFAELKSNNLINSIEKSKKTTLGSFIFALGIKNIGQKASRELEKTFKTLENILNASPNEIQNIQDFGEIMTNNVVDFFKNDANLQQIEKLINLGVNFVEQKVISEGAFLGKNVVLTGSMQKYKRREAEHIIISQGGNVSSAVTRSVNLVVAGVEAGSKLTKAEKLGIEIINEQQFIELIEN